MRRPLKPARPAERLPKWQITSGLNHGRESRKFNQGCAICVSCPQATSELAGPEQRGNRHQMAGLRMASEGMPTLGAEPRSMGFSILSYSSSSKPDLSAKSTQSDRSRNPSFSLRRAR